MGRSAITVAAPRRHERRPSGRRRRPPVATGPHPRSPRRHLRAAGLPRRRAGRAAGPNPLGTSSGTTSPRSSKPETSSAPIPTCSTTRTRLIGRRALLARPPGCGMPPHARRRPCLEEATTHPAPAPAYQRPSPGHHGPSPRLDVPRSPGAGRGGRRPKNYRLTERDENSHISGTGSHISLTDSHISEASSHSSEPGTHTPPAAASPNTDELLAWIREREHVPAETMAAAIARLSITADPRAAWLAIALYAGARSIMGAQRR